ncbi:glutamine--fructose-6-phosphate transaminase (isomerizing) [Feifania hominis]|uniref:Glutamine--fructose-6-phosphate aminotransferase [isomerizing] n=1 Tax=Feifania hominis TaxID=2763660 RepID=A0A926DEA5_9FIRM|nr:glutamine--fructose-6-phosphate transaminase (isomerizing) [Feifania hominis]MBC8536626.1 glutamine--fructose-6-phosphate transaminase (isomerizing) [Feifania hominis]
MCGIVGFTGAGSATDILIRGLKKLEYRGYDSAGIAVFHDGDIRIVKAKGRLANLEEKIKGDSTLTSTCGIGHTRWATHGEPSDVNSHPHDSHRITVVHNGIIENYMRLKEFLTGKGYEFKSETDTEVVAHLIDYYYKGDLLDAVITAAGKLRGSYALGILCRDDPTRIVALRKDSPLIVGLGKDGNFIASDIPAILEHTKDYYLLDEGDIAVLEPGGVTVYNMEREIVQKEKLTATWDVAAAEKGGYAHFMLKEIMETPKVLADTINPRVENGEIHLEHEAELDELFRSVKKVMIVACGSASHVGYAAKYVIERLARVPTEVDIASEYRYRDPIVEPGDLVLVISQSGETADTLAALRLAKSRGAKVACIVNVVGSSIARESDYVLYTWAGPEIAVATTKAFSAQLAVIDLFAVRLALVRGAIDEAHARELTAAIAALPEQAKALLAREEECKRLAARYQNAKDLFFIGRGLDYAIAMEGSLKLKEISYIHSEVYAAGELKHGTISLVVDDTPVIAIATQSHLIEKTVSNIKEVKARHAKVLAVCREGALDGDVADDIFTIPDGEDLFVPSLDVIPLQLLSYYIAVLRGCDVDKPRNLAKSVTVE